MNALVLAHTKLKQHINTALGLADSVEKRREELLKLDKEVLVEMLLASTRVDGVKIEDIAKAVLEDPDCAWLDYSTIAEAIVKAIPTAKTSDKSLASYASKNPREKGWAVIPRKSNRERSEVLQQLINK